MSRFGSTNSTRTIRYVIKLSPGVDVLSVLLKSQLLKSHSGPGQAKYGARHEENKEIILILLEIINLAANQTPTHSREPTHQREFSSNAGDGDDQDMLDAFLYLVLITILPFDVSWFKFGLSSLPCGRNEEDQKLDFAFLCFVLSCKINEYG